MARTCTICTHPERQTIDESLVSRVPYRDIAKRHDVTLSALSRHMDGHVSPALAAIQAEKEQQGAETAFDMFVELRDEARSILDAAKEDGKPTIALNAIARLESIVVMMAKITGELNERPQVMVNLFESPEMRQLIRIVQEVCTAHPELRAEIARRLAEASGDPPALEGGPS